MDSYLNPFNPSKLSWISFLFFFFTILFLNIPSTTSLIRNQNPDSQSQYDRFCNHIVPKSSLDTEAFSFVDVSPQIRLKTGYFSGGDKLIGPTPGLASVNPRNLLFFPYYAHKTVSPGVYKVQANLNLRGSGSAMMNSVSGNSRNRRLRLVRYRGPKIQPWKRKMVFLLDGFWSESSGKLCMVGSGTSYMKSGVLQSLNVVLKLNYPRNVTILHSLITGTLESLDDSSSVSYFEPISMLSVAQTKDYKHTLMDNGIGDGCMSGNYRGLDLSHKVCSVIGDLFDKFDLEYESDCDDVNCSPLGKNVGYSPNSMYFQGIACTDEGKMQMLLGFTNSSYRGSRFPFEPSETLIAEGIWDQKENRLCAVACRILNFTESLTNAYVGNCSTKFSLILPAVLSMRNRNTVVGQIWSTEAANESDYFRKIGFHSYNEMLVVPLQIKYNYTAVDGRSSSSCPKNKNVYVKGKSFPNENSSDMRFYMSIKNRKGQIARGFSMPLFVGEHFYWNHVNQELVNFSLSVSAQKESAVQMNSIQSSSLYISYRISFSTPPDFKLVRENFSYKIVEISAEGLYDKNSGSLCMTGCWQRELMKNRTLDCEIVINVQFPPLDASGGEHVKGTIESKRLKSDPLYFDQLELSSDSIYESQAKESIWRMDLEITMVLVSKTLACLFLVLQLFYVNKHPDVLPYISIFMVIVLCLGHMIPLLLNFEALFAAKRNQQSVFLGSGGWLEVNEVIVRVVTMVVFLLQLRLLQLTWSSRQGNTSEKGLWDSEKKVTYVTLPLYAIGVFIAWFVYKWKNSYNSSYRHMTFLQPHRKGYQLYPLQKLSYQQNSFWEVLKSFAGLILDGFLVPQIIFNSICDSQESALSFSFYMGTTFVRLLPHAYDLYRARHSSWYLDLSYIYANHKLDFYSTSWDIIIPCGGLLLATVIFLQQRFGGRCIIRRVLVHKQGPVYDKVPAISNEEL